MPHEHPAASLAERQGFPRTYQEAHRAPRARCETLDCLQTGSSPYCPGKPCCHMSMARVGASWILRGTDSRSCFSTWVQSEPSGSRRSSGGSTMGPKGLLVSHTGNWELAAQTTHALS